MARDVDKAALHATLDLMLRALSKPGATGAPATQAQPDALVTAYQGAKAKLRDWGARDPMDALGAVVSTGTAAFYLAEKGKNPRCKDIWDALTFVTTCLSVGYHNVFAVTPAGKAIASFLMTVGPSLAARTFEAPRAEAERAETEAATTQRAIVERLDAILEALRASSPPAR
jgi:voltage-gated potassium channel